MYTTSIKLQRVMTLPLMLKALPTPPTPTKTAVAQSGEPRVAVQPSTPISAPSTPPKVPPFMFALSLSVRAHQRLASPACPAVALTEALLPHALEGDQEEHALQVQVRPEPRPRVWCRLGGYAPPATCQPGSLIQCRCPGWNDTTKWQKCKYKSAHPRPSTY